LNILTNHCPTVLLLPNCFLIICIWTVVKPSDQTKIEIEEQEQHTALPFEIIKEIERSPTFSAEMVEEQATGKKKGKKEL